jgi:hypothetical protein
MKSALRSYFQQIKTKAKRIRRISVVCGNEENEYITRHTRRVRHLAKLNTDNATKAKIDEISKDGISFLDRKF